MMPKSGTGFRKTSCSKDNGEISQVPRQRGLDRAVRPEGVHAEPTMSEAPATAPPLAHTPLHALHVARGARMVPFAGYEMPVQYADGIIAEHTHTREAAGLFDVSHMGQAFVVGPAPERLAQIARAHVSHPH